MSTALFERRPPPERTGEVSVLVSIDADVVTARQKGREIAAAAGFSDTDLTVIATAISEIARNIVKFAQRGQIVVRMVEQPGRRGVTVVARDFGPGIADVGAAMQDGFSTYRGLGLGLAGARRLMDEFEIESRVGVGTTVTMAKWRINNVSDEEVAAMTADSGLQDRFTEDDMLLPELVAHLRENRTQLRQEWASRITDAHLLSAMTHQEIFSEATSVYDNYVEVLETGSVEALQHYARDLSERIIPRGVETDEVVGIVLLLRDVLARSLFEKYHTDFPLLNRILDAYEPAANRIANTVAVSFVDERERVIRQQQDAIRELSTPVLQVRERLLILPIIGVLDAPRAQSTHRAAAPRHPHAPRQGGGCRHHRRSRYRPIGRQSPGSNCRRLPADGCPGDRHRALLGNSADAGDHRRGPGQDHHRW